MSVAKKVGIWMVHQTAHVIEFTSDPVLTTAVDVEFTHQAKEGSVHQGENKMHTKEQHQQAEYYKELGKVIQQYDSVILFGPTQAKTELFNILTEDQHFSNIKIDVKQADKMTENQLHAFVKDFFTTSN
jgi:stalled ribosome rescue protein Dom34